MAGLSTGERGRFLLGRALFERLATADEGLGPLYNQERCSDCHDQPAVGGSGTQRVRVLKATRFADGRCDLLHGEGGDNIQRRATDLLVAHGMGPEEVPAAATATALMTAPSLLGLGLIEAVPDTVLAERADPDDLDGALRFELGFTTPGHPTEEARNGVPVPADAAPGELRTAPLWGLRYRDRLLHDGRAEDVPAAVSAHGGEAAGARDAFLALPDDARRAVIRFLRSLS